ncbi:MAG: hypothetical protein IKH27_07710 [Oscillospiraceae bacterium]|nr:hypothetical protein [Oscillospiraceae bacterium]
MKRKHYLILAASALAAGTLVYVFYNQSPVVFAVLFQNIHVPKLTVRNPILACFLKCYCADLCWAISFSFLVQSILMLNRKQAHWLLLTSALGIIAELLQLFHIMKGVFDVNDIIVYLIGTIITAIIVRLGGKQYESNAE